MLALTVGDSVVNELACFDIWRGDGFLVVTVGGEIDLSNCEQLHDVVVQATSGETPVVIDLSSVDYLDSTAISTLVAAARRTGLTGGRLRLVVPRASLVRRTLVIADVPNLMPVDETLQAAISAVRSELAPS